MANIVDLHLESDELYALIYSIRSLSVATLGKDGNTIVVESKEGEEPKYYKVQRIDSTGKKFRLLLQEDFDIGIDEPISEGELQTYLMEMGNPSRFGEKVTGWANVVGMVIRDQSLVAINGSGPAQVRNVVTGATLLTGSE